MLVIGSCLLLAMTEYTKIMELCLSCITKYLLYWKPYILCGVGKGAVGP